jgi:hypothetical protein
VVVDGAGSQLRDDAPTPRRASVYPWGAIWHVAPDPARVFRDELFQVVDGAEVMVGFLPTGLGPGDDVPVVSPFWSPPRWCTMSACPSRPRSRSCAIR